MALAALNNHYGKPSRADHSAAYEQRQTEPVAAAGSLSQGPSAESKTARQEERAERDLKAQEEMAKWAFWLFVVTVAGVLLLAATLRETWKAGRSAAEIFTQTRRQADIAEKSLSPFIAICIDETIFEWTRTDESGTQITGYWYDPHVRFYFRNYGQTPAVIKLIKAELDDGQRPPDLSQIVVSFAPTPDHIIEAGKPTETFKTQPKALSDELKGRLKLGFSFLWLYGTVEFEDMFGNEFVSEFCWRHDGPQSVFAPYDEDRKRNRTYRKNDET